MEALLLHLQGGVGDRALAVRLCLPVAGPATKTHTISQSHAKAEMQKQQRRRSPGARGACETHSAQYA